MCFRTDHCVFVLAKAGQPAVAMCGECICIK